MLQYAFASQIRKWENMQIDIEIFYADFGALTKTSDMESIIKDLASQARSQAQSGAESKAESKTTFEADSKAVSKSAHKTLHLDSSVRLDECLASALDVSRSQIQGLIKNIGVLVNDAFCTKCGVKIANDTHIFIALPKSSQMPNIAQISQNAPESSVKPKTLALESSAPNFTPESNIKPNSATALESTTSASLNASAPNATENIAQESSTTPESTTQTPSSQIEIIYQDASILVLNKPAFLVVHSAPSVREPTLVDWLKAQGFSLSTLGGQERFGIVHRLDKETSGAIAIAKDNATHAHLSDQLREKSMGRYYLALIDAPLKEPKIISCHLARHPKNRLKMANIDNMRQSFANARFSKSAFVPLINMPNAALVAVKLFTGRTHQIRAHLESIQRHIIGDELYGYKKPAKLPHKPRIMLHAYMLYLTHPLTQKSLSFCAKVPEDMLQYANEIFGAKEFDEAIRTERILQAFSEFGTDC